MKVTQFDTLYQLTFFPNLFPINCYIIEEETELTLIDTGLASHGPKIIEVIKSLSKPLSTILLTHGHDDHVGSVDILKKEFPDAQLCISARDSLLLNGDKRLLDDEGMLPIKGGISTKIKSSPDRLLYEQNTVGSLKVISSPGHTPGSISLFDERNSFLIAGDAFQTKGGIAVAGTLKLTFPFPAFATWDKNRSLNSAKQLASLHPKLLAVGHGTCIKDPYEAMMKAIQKAENTF